MNTQDTPPADSPKKSPVGWREAGIFLALLILNYTLAAMFFGTAAPHVSIPYSPTFLNQIKKDNVVSVSATASVIDGKFRHPVRYGTTKATPDFRTQVPDFANTTALDSLLQQHNVVVKANSTTTPFWQTLLVGLGPTLLLIALWVGVFKAQSGGVSGMFSMGRSKAKRYEPTHESVSFKDVAGIDDAKQELTEIVDFLRNPEKYAKLGAHIPRGVLLSGQPGTGKTLLAKAVAGEAGVPFFSMSASEFVEMIVGVGASRVRDLFAQAKEAAPSIIFIDEIDAIGRSRSSGAMSGSNDEREQTLNQILTEMDGFDASTGVIVLAATNRPDVLDKALLRPGRFDRRVTIQPPDLEGRKQILLVHTRSLPLAPDVDLDALASSTVGMVGADLANLSNEAALLAARRSHTQVQMADFSDSLEKIMLGAERKLGMSDEERRRTAYHESGHALVGMLTPGADPVRKISIIPRSYSLGVTISTPGADKVNYDKEYLVARIMVATGGRAAEEVVFGNQTSGAESDIKQATQLARAMIGRFGMSDTIGFVNVLGDESDPYASQGPAQISERTRRRIDDEVKRTIDEAHEAAVALLRENRDKLESLTAALVKAETLDEPEAYAAAGIAATPTPAATPELVTA